ncbi:ComEC/Rec2 family competence protein [Treponema zioleckii]|uniref:ComEC/Rec2 family competence protein n=1 Tax=Treponema zioleckii TaxID=331680 RepID=UPI00168BD73B|nr:ComEC/Rec2 family competence protein [Treponema zioleckii]
MVGEFLKKLKNLRFKIPTYFFSPVFVAAIICAAVIYSFAANVNSTKMTFRCLFSSDEISTISGKIISNPVKSFAFNGSYRTEIAVKHVFTLDGSKSTADGKVTLYIPQEIVESNFPGKLYSAARHNAGFIIETGANLSVECSAKKMKNGELCFLAQNVKEWNFENSFSGRFARFRALCRLNFRRIMFAWGKAGGLLLALLSSSKEYTEATISDSFKNAGLSHILALSGMHLSLFGGLVLLFGKKVARRNIADAIQVLAILFFVWFAGLSPSLFRALLAALILYFSSLLRMRRPDGIFVLSACFLIHCVVFPDHVKTAAFMLSYSSLLGILVLSGIVKRIFSRAFLPHLSSSLSESLSAQIFTAPVTISLFAKLMPIGIIASVFVAPLITLFIYLGLFGMLICFLLPFLSPCLSVIINVVYDLIKKLVIFFAGFPAIQF